MLYDVTDFDWCWSGDYKIEGGDIGSTEDSPLQSLIQDIFDVLRCDIDDWSLYPANAAALSDFIGEANTKALADKIKQRIVMSLTVSSRVVYPSDLSIDIFPVAIDELMIYMKIRVIPTEANEMTRLVEIASTFSYEDERKLKLTYVNVARGTA